MTTGTRQFWTEFIDLYKSLPQLWNKNLETFDDSLESEAYDILLNKLSDIEPDAHLNRKTVKKRIDALKCYYVKEFNKLKEMAQSTSQSDKETIFISGLWYFNLFSFMDEFISKENTPEDERLRELIHEKCVIRPRNSTLPWYIRPCVTTPSYDVMTNLKADLQNMDEEGRILAEYFTTQYRELDPSQRDIVKEGIEEILRQAQLGKLHRDSLVINETQHRD